MVEHAADVVELFADIDAATGQLGVRRLDVGHDKILVPSQGRPTWFPCRR
jgi:hypothetical protein